MALPYLILAILLAFFSASAEATIWQTIKSMFEKQTQAPPPNVKVLIAHDTPGVVLEVRGKYKIYNPHNNTHLATRFVGKRKYVEALPEGIKWGEEFPGIHQIMLVPDDPHTSFLVDGNEYKGLLYVYDVGGAISVVNELDIENYLAAVLTSKLEQKLTSETLAALAIASRTNTYYLLSNPKNNFWSVDASLVGFKGVGNVNPKSPVMNALRSTHYMVMSKTGAYEGYVTAFPVKWGVIPLGASTKDQPVVSKISLHDAEEIAKKGGHAAQILQNAFPGMTIQLIHNPSDANLST